MGRHTQPAPTAAVISATSALALALASGALTGPAQAETGTWHQSFERSGPDATCEAPEMETPWQSSFRGQQEWTPSWAQWPHNGTGGWVCNRTIVWAQTSGPTLPSAGCVLSFTDFDPFGTLYLDFQGGYALSGNEPAYTDSACTTPAQSDGNPVLLIGAYVYAPPGFDANALCQRAFGLPAQPSNETPDDVVNCEA